MGEKERKVRTDKKIEIRPTVPISLYETISRISYITNSPIKDIGEVFCINGLYSKKVINALSKKFRRDYWLESTLYRGNGSKMIERTIRIQGEKTRVSIRFSQDTYHEINKLAFVLDMTISSATTLLLEASLKEHTIINNYFAAFIGDQLDKNRLKELKEVLKFINKNNPYEVEISIVSLMHFIFENIVDETRNLKNAVVEWLDQINE